MVIRNRKLILQLLLHEGDICERNEKGIKGFCLVGFLLSQRKNYDTMNFG